MKYISIYKTSCGSVSVVAPDFCECRGQTYVRGWTLHLTLHLQSKFPIVCVTQMGSHRNHSASSSFYTVILNEIHFVFSADPAVQLDVKFDEKLKCLMVTGCINNVEVAMKFIKANYLDVICVDKLEIVQPGYLICCLWCKCYLYIFTHLQSWIHVFAPSIGLGCMVKADLLCQFSRGIVAFYFSVCCENFLTNTVK